MTKGLHPERFPHGLSFVSHGARVRVVSNDPGVLAGVQRRLPPRSRRGSSPGADVLYVVATGTLGPDGTTDSEHPHLLFLDGSLAGSATSLPALLDLFESSVDFQVAMAARRRLFVHAGVVAVGRGAVVIPGRSFSGKSSLVLALVQAGATYLSDEYAVLDRRGLVHSWTRPLALRYPDKELRSTLPASTLGPPAPREPLPVTAVVSTVFEPGAQFRPRSLSGGQGVLSLLDNTLMAQAKPRLAMSTLSRAIAGAVVLDGVRGDAGPAAEEVLRRIRRR